MKIKLTKKFAAVIILSGVILTGAYFVLGNTGQSGPESAPNLGEYGLVGHWNFEEGSGQTIHDRSGNGNDGTLGANSSIGKDDPVFAAGHDSSGPGGMGMEFDGVDDYINIPDNNDSLDLGNYFTISLWIKKTQDANALIINKGGSWGGDLRWYLATSPAGNFIEFGIDTTDQLYGTVDVIDGMWHFVTATYENGSGTLYVDGILDNSESGWELGSPNDLGVYIGAWASGNYSTDGQIDSVRIYNRALSADEIRMLYNQKKPVMELKFDEGSGTTAHDESFNNNDATFPAADGNKPEWSAP